MLNRAAELAASKQVHSFYLYNLDDFSRRVSAFKDLFPDYFHAHFAVKSNFHPRVLEVVKKQGLGADVVSQGEVVRALESGFAPEQIIFSGVGKTKKEIRFAIENKIAQINVESLPELERISAIAKDMGQKIKVSLRVNPNVDADTHPYIRTGLLENKFGIDFQSAEAILNKFDKYHVDINGLTMHIGSQILDTEPFFEAAEKVLQLYLKYQAKVPTLEVLDLGGGLGLEYELKSNHEEVDFARAKSYASGLIKLTEKAVEAGHLKSVYLEPGRFLSARMGYLCTQVQYIKRTDHKNFLIVDTGMHHLMRPCLYKAFHRIDSLNTTAVGDTELFDVVGPICESSDVLGKDRLFPKSIQEDDWLVIHDAGAYGAVMASQYNLKEEAPEYFWENGELS